MDDLKTDNGDEVMVGGARGGATGGAMDGGEVAALGGEIPVEEQLANALSANEALSARVTALETEIADANAAKDAAEARAKAKVARGVAPPKPRKLGPMEPVLSGDDLRTALAEATSVEVAFSDGNVEIAGMAPIAVQGDVWKSHTLGLMLRDPVLVEGPSGGPASIAGYALIIDGKPVAYTPRSDVLNLMPNMSVSLADDIYFT